MGDVERQYRDILKKYCEKVTPEYFPGLETSDLMRREITLEDVYVPLALREYSFVTEATRRGTGLKRKKMIFEKQQDSNMCTDEIFEDDYDSLLEGVEFQEDEDICDILDKIGGAICKINEKENQEVERLKVPLVNRNIVNKFCKNENSMFTGMRILLRSPAGGGKTAFCKRLTLAYLKNEDNFFEQCVTPFTETRFNSGKKTMIKSEWKKNTFPLLLQCKYLREKPLEELENVRFPELAYKLCCMEFGDEFRCIGYENFYALLERKVGCESCFILDGWNEILNSQKEDKLWQIVSEYLQNYPTINLVVAIRAEYGCLLEWQHAFNHFFEIKQLTGKEVETICERWYKVIFHDISVKKKNYMEITKQILHFSNAVVRKMAERPLTLLLLLAIFRYNGKLPENEAELFEELFKICLLGNTNKGENSIKPETVKLYLCYIATYFTKNQIAVFTYDDLADVIRQCNIDLRNSLPDQINDYEISELIGQLLASGVFDLGAVDGFTFSRFERMQEYLTAYAILTQSADEEYNNMEPGEILKAKYKIIEKKAYVKKSAFRLRDTYEISSWKNVIVFVALMNTGKLRYTIIKKLLKRAKKTKSAYISFCTHTDESEETVPGEMAFCAYRDMLNEILAGVPDISPDYRQKINEIINA